MNRTLFLSTLCLCVLFGVGIAQADNSRLRSLKQRHLKRYHAGWRHTESTVQSVQSYLLESSSRSNLEIVELVPKVPTDQVLPPTFAK